MTQYEIGQLYRAGMLRVYGGSHYGALYRHKDHRMMFWQLVALSEGVYRG
jgi:hypothetical protein